MLLRSGRITQHQNLPSYVHDNFVLQKGIVSCCIKCGGFLDAIRAIYHMDCEVIIVQCNACRIYNCCDISHLSANFYYKRHTQ